MAVSLRVGLHDLARQKGNVRRVVVLADDVEVIDVAHPAYRDDPLAETLRAIEGIAADRDFAASYATFRRDMVYGEGPDFGMAIATLKSLAELLKTGQ